MHSSASVLPTVALCELNDLAAHHLQSARNYADSVPTVCMFIDMAMLELRRQIHEAELRPQLKPVQTGLSPPVHGKSIRRFKPAALD